MKTNALSIGAVLILLPAAAAMTAEFSGPFHAIGSTLTVHAGKLCTDGPGDCSGTPGNPDFVQAIADAAKRWTDNSRFIDMSVSGTSTAGGECNGNIDRDIAFFGTTNCSSSFQSSTTGTVVTTTDADGTLDRFQMIFNRNYFLPWEIYDGPLAPDSEDIRRVAARQIGDVFGLEYYDNDLALMRQNLNQISEPQPDDLFGLAHLHGDAFSPFVAATDGSAGGLSALAGAGAGKGAIAMLRMRPDRRFEAERRNASNGQLLGKTQFLGLAFSVLRLISVGDLDNDGIDELAAAGVNDTTGEIIVQVRNGATGAKIQNIYFLGAAYLFWDLVAIPNADGNGNTGLALLADRAEGGSPIVQIKNPLTGQLISTIRFLGATYFSLAVIAVPDTDNNGIPEVAIIAVRDADGAFLVQGANTSGTPNRFTRFFLGPSFRPYGGLIKDNPWYEPVSAHAIDDGQGNIAIAIMAVRLADNAVIIQRVSPRGAVNRGNTYFLSSDYNPLEFTVVDDAGTLKYALLARRRSDHAIVAQVKRVFGSGPVQNFFVMDANYTPIAIRAFDDGTGAERLAIIAHRGGDDRIRMDTRSLAGERATFFFSPY